MSFEIESNGAVFAGGSLGWDSTNEVDEGVSRITSEVLERF